MNPLMPNLAPGFRVALFIVAFSLLASSVDRAANTTFVGGQAGDSANGTRLLLSQGEEVSSSVAVSLSDATIQRASRVGQVFGSFNLSAYAFPDYSGGSAGAIEFGSIRHTPSSFLVLDIANFTLGNKPVFQTTHNLSIEGFSFTGTGGLGGSSFDGSTFTAIPESSSPFAVAGLLGMMLCSVSHRTPLRTSSTMTEAPVADGTIPKADGTISPLLLA